MSKGEVDLELGWERLPGEAEDSPRLNRANLYLLACREAFRTRLPDEGAQKFLDRFRVKLRIPIEDARRMMQRAREDMQEGRLEPAERFDPEEVFRKACTFAETAGAANDAQGLLKSLSRALRIPERSSDSTIYLRAVQADALPPGAQEAPQEVPLPEEPQLQSFTIEASKIAGPRAPALAPPPGTVPAAPPPMAPPPAAPPPTPPPATGAPRFLSGPAPAPPGAPSASLSGAAPDPGAAAYAAEVSETSPRTSTPALSLSHPAPPSGKAGSPEAPRPSLSDSSLGLYSDGELIEVDARNRSLEGGKLRLAQGAALVCLCVAFLVVPASQYVNLLRMLVVLGLVAGLYLIVQGIRGASPGDL